MNTYIKTEILNNLMNHPELIKEVRVYGDRAYLTLAFSQDRRNDLSVNLTTGVLFIKKMANGMYKETGMKLAALVNDINW